MADVITRLKVESSEYDSKIKRATQSLNEMTTSAEREGSKIATANKENIALAQSLGKMATVSSNTRGKMSELTAAIEAATIQYNRLSAAEKQGQFGKALNASIGQLQTRLKGLQGEMAAVNAQMGKVGAIGGMGGFGAGIKGGLAMMGPQAAGFAAVAAAAMGVKKVIGDMININKEFEQGTANLASIMGEETDEISALTNQAKQLGATTRYTAMQITDLQTNLARLGFTQQEILNSTTAVQAFATATGADLGEAANLAGAALRGFGLNATEMERVASVMAVSTTKSALSFEKLATAVPIVAPVAKQFGFTIEDTITLLGKLSDAGMDASTAATATRNIFLKMANDSGKLAQAMGRPVHSVEEFGEALKEMREKGMSLNDILEMVGVRSTAAFAVFADNAETLKDFKTSITDCSDAMHDMEAKQLNTLQGSITILNSAWEGLMLTFSDSNGVIKTVVDSLTELLQAYTRWRNRNQGGDAAIQSYELGVSNSQKQQADQIVAGYRAGGSTDKQIAENINKTKQKLQEEEAELRKVYDLWEKRYNLIKSGKSGLANSDEFAILREKGLSNTTDARDSLAMQIAGLRDQQAVQDYMLGLVTPAPSATKETGGTSSNSEEKSKSQIALLRAQYEAEEKEQIAHLDRMNMTEEQYEDSVFTIKKETFEKTLQLYDSESKQYAQVKARMAQLDIDYQSKKINLAKKAEREAAKSAKTEAKAYTGYGDITQKSVSARISTSQNRLSTLDIGSGRYMIEAEKLVDLQTFQNLLNVALKNGLSTDNLMDKLVGFEGIDLGFNIADEDWKTLVDEINAQLKDLAINPIELDVKTGAVSVDDQEKKVKVLGEGWNAVANAIGTVGGALQNLEDPSAKVAGIIAEAIANIALSFAQAAASPAVTGTGWGWLGFAVSGIATMVSTITAIKSVTAGSYANGGIVGGNSFSGDNLTANVNSGELILNRAQQESVAAQLQGNNPISNIQVTGKLSGKDIVFAISNYQMEKGVSGKYVQTH